MINFHIRAEFPDGGYKDFRVGAEDIELARVLAEEKIVARVGERLGVDAPTFDWRGAVVFVGQRQEVRNG